jgi:thioredoxin 1
LIPVSFETFEALVEQPSTKHLVAVNCWAEWCGPSTLLEPICERTSQKLAYRMDFVKLNIDDNPELADKFGLRSLPAIMLFNDEEPLALISGLIPEDALKAELEYILSMIQQ